MENKKIVQMVDDILCQSKKITDRESKATVLIDLNDKQLSVLIRNNRIQGSRSVTTYSTKPEDFFEEIEKAKKEMSSKLKEKKALRIAELEKELEILKGENNENN